MSFFRTRFAYPSNPKTTFPGERGFWITAFLD